MNKRTLTLLVLLTLIISALWFMGSWWYYTKLKCDCEPTTITQSGDSGKAATGIKPSAAVSTAPATIQEITANDPVIDTDGDGLSDVEEKQTGTDPEKSDTDGDGIPDNEELGAELSIPIDTDKDGIIDALDPDDDNDSLSTLIEGEIGTSPLLMDTDGDGLDDAQEIGDISNEADKTKTIKVPDTDEDGTIDALDIDDDDDGLDTASELLLGTNHLLADSDGDGVSDSIEIGKIVDQAKDSDSDGIIDALDNQDNTDTDDDGVPDVLEATLGLDPKKSDSDDDGIDDIEEIGADYNQPLDVDGDGIINALDADDDGDNLPTLLESNIGTNPLSPDSDDDGLDDAIEVGENYKSILDSDGDGIINPLDSDDDNDGLDTRLELSLKTDPTKSDSDADGVDDNKEVGANTSSPLDSDSDGIIDALDPVVDKTDSADIAEKQDDKQDIKQDNKQIAVKQQEKDADGKLADAAKDEDELISEEVIADSVKTDKIPADSESKDKIDIVELEPVTDKQTGSEEEGVKTQESNIPDSNIPDSETAAAEKETSDGKITAEIIKQADGNTPQSLRLYFPFNSEKSEITSGLSNYFTTVVNWLKSDPKHVIQIVGHTDNVGPEATNLALGIRRVMVIREFLIEAGAPFQQIDFLSRGESEPIADNKTEQGRLRNRRVELLPIAITK